MPAAARLMQPVVRPIAGRIAEERRHEVFQRDRAFIERVRPLTRLTGYFSPTVRGLDNLPDKGPVLVVANHSCLYYIPDAWVVAEAVASRRGLDTPSYALVYDLLLAVPGYGRFLRRIGAIPAGHPEADEALRRGAAVIVYPGGDTDACRPWRQRDRVDLAGRTGFVRLALRHHVPVVPVVAHGAHHAVVVATRGEAVARTLGITGLHIHVFPFVLGPPLGINPLLAVPMPAKITVEFLPPVDWSGRDEAAAEELYDDVVARMQAAMDRLAAEVRHPVVTGSVALARRAVGVPARVAGAPLRSLSPALRPRARGRIR